MLYIVCVHIIMYTEKFIMYTESYFDRKNNAAFDIQINMF